MVKKILSILVWLVTAGGIITLFIFGRGDYLSTPIDSVSLNIERESDKGFIIQDSLLHEIERICHLRSHTPVGSVDMISIEKHLKSNPWIESASAFIDLNGILNINVREYEPFLRVFNKESESVYINERGIAFPSSKTYSARVLVADGNFIFPSYKDINDSDSVFQASGIAEALHIQKAIKKDKFLEASIGQLHRNNNGEFELTVNDVRAVVLLGDTTNVDENFKKMKGFLQHKLGSEEMENFEKLNLKYKNQIVCTKQK